MDEHVHLDAASRQWVLWGNGQWTVDSGYSSNRNYKTFVRVYKMQHILLFLFLSLLRFVFSFFLAVFAFDWPHSSCVNVLGPFGSLPLSLCLSVSVCVGSQEVTSPRVVVGEKVANRIEQLLLTRFDCNSLVCTK